MHHKILRPNTYKDDNSDIRYVKGKPSKLFKVDGDFHFLDHNRYLHPDLVHQVDKIIGTRTYTFPSDPFQKYRISKNGC